MKESFVPPLTSTLIQSLPKNIFFTEYLQFSQYISIASLGNWKNFKKLEKFINFSYVIDENQPLARISLIWMIWNSKKY